MAEADIIDLPSSKKGKTPTQWNKYWTKEIEAAQKRFKRFRKQGNAVVDRYLDKRSGFDDDIGYPSSTNGIEQSLNLFHSNITTQQAMLYGNTPKIDVSREHDDPDDDVARVASTVIQRILQAEVEGSGDRFPTALKSALCDRLLPGMGVARVRYEFESSTVTQIDPMTMEAAPVEQIEYEDAPIDYVHWQDYLYGWCRTWSEMPWMGFRNFLSKEEATKRFSKKVADSLTYQKQLPTGTKEDSDNAINYEQKDDVEKAAIWEIWCKKERKVFWWSEGQDIILDAEDDPLGLDGFWPAPMPMMANLTTSLYMAQADFITSQDLYNEIDILQTRIMSITRAVKVVGVYDKNATDSVGRMLQEGVENSMIPVDNWAMFAEKGGLKGTIDWFPVETVVGTLQTLIQIRDQTIQLLNMVTGMSDLMKGNAGGQYTAASSNEIAAKMGSIRIQALQEDFARFASDLQAIRAEVIAKQFTVPSIIRQSAAQFLPMPDRDKIMPAIELIKSSDIKWRINIRPESIAMVDYAMVKQERNEFLMSMATYIQSAQAAVKAIPGSLPVLLEMLKWAMAGYKGADYMEGMMDQAIEMAMSAPPQGQDDGKAQAEQAKSQAELQKIQAKAAADLQLIQAKSQGELQKRQQDFEFDIQTQQAKAQSDMQKIAADLQADLRVIAAKLGADLQVEEAQSTMAIAEIQSQAEVDSQQTLLQHSAKMDEIDEQNEYREDGMEDD